MRWAYVRSFFDSSVATASLLWMKYVLVRNDATITHVRRRAVAVTSVAVSLDVGEILPCDVAFVVMGACTIYAALNS